MIGMLWFDHDPQTNLDQKLRQAVGYFTGKYGAAPTWCRVHPSMLAEEPQVGVIRVIADRRILPHHFYLGVGDGG